MPENASEGSTLQHGVRHRRFRVEGVMACPTADGELKLIRLHAPYEMATVEFAAQRHGAYPIVPHPEHPDPNFVMVGGEQVANTPEIVQNGGHVWTLDGSYSYAMKAAKGLDSEIKTGKAPFEQTGSGQNTIPAAAFSKQLNG